MLQGNANVTKPTQQHQMTFFDLQSHDISFCDFYTVSQKDKTLDFWL